MLLQVTSFRRTLVLTLVVIAANVSSAWAERLPLPKPEKQASSLLEALAVGIFEGCDPLPVANQKAFGEAVFAAYWAADHGSPTGTDYADVYFNANTLGYCILPDCSADFTIFFEEAYTSAGDHRVLDGSRASIVPDKPVEIVLTETTAQLPWRENPVAIESETLTVEKLYVNTVCECGDNSYGISFEGSVSPMRERRARALAYRNDPLARLRIDRATTVSGAGRPSVTMMCDHSR